jgi:DNA segregation ATPase FtsK/SpoIIIE-like protein
MMEQEGIIGPFRGSKPREILVDKDTWLEKNN